MLLDEYVMEPTLEDELTLVREKIQILEREKDRIDTQLIRFKNDEQTLLQKHFDSQLQSISINNDQGEPQ